MTLTDDVVVRREVVVDRSRPSASAVQRPRHGDGARLVGVARGAAALRRRLHRASPGRAAGGRASGPAAARASGGPAFDIEVPDIESEAARLVALGATRVSEGPCRELGSTWLLMADPEGNEFCVCDAGQPQDQSP